MIGRIDALEFSEFHCDVIVLESHCLILTHCSRLWRVRSLHVNHRFSNVLILVFHFRLIATVVPSKRACASVITCTNSTAAWRHTWTTVTPLTSFDRQTVDSSLNWEGELIFALGVATLNIFDSKQTEATNLSCRNVFLLFIPILFRCCFSSC